MTIAGATTAPGSSRVTVQVAATTNDAPSNDGGLTWVWTSDKMEDPLLYSSQGDTTLTGEAATGTP